MRQLVKNFLIEIKPYRIRWYTGIFCILLLGAIGIASFFRNIDIMVGYVLFAFPFMSVCLWTALTLSNSRIIQANKKLEEKNGL